MPLVELGRDADAADDLGVGQHQRLPFGRAVAAVLRIDADKHAAAHPYANLPGGPVDGGPLPYPSWCSPGLVGLSDQRRVPMDLSERDEPA